MTGEQIWHDIAGSIRGQIGSPCFTLWFKDLPVIAFDGETLTLGVPNSFHRAWMLHRYVPTLQQAMHDAGHDVSLDMVLLPPKPVLVVSEEPCVRVLTRAAG
jgi:chromosomal replication initiation ATPase DnaA